MDNADTPDEEIKELYAYGAGLQSLSDIVGLDRFVKLEFLSLHGNHIERIQGLEGLPLLKELNLSSNNIKEMEGLTKLSELQVLNLSCNHIEEIKDLQGLFALGKLLLSHNRISCLGGLSALRGPRYALQLLDLRDNVVSSLSELDVLAGCVNLTELIFSCGNHSNPVCRAPAYKFAVIAAAPYILKLDGQTLCPESGPTQSPSLIGGNVQSKNVGSLLPSWALQYKDDSLQNLPFDAKQAQPRQVFIQPQPEISISSKQQRRQNTQPQSQFLDSPHNHPYLNQGQLCHKGSPSAVQPTSAHSLWFNHPSSSHLLSMGNLSHPYNNEILTSSHLQNLGPDQGCRRVDCSTKSCAGLPLRKQHPTSFDSERNPRTEIFHGDLDVPKADQSSQTNQEAWLGALEKRILDLVQQLPNGKADPQGELTGHHDDAAVSKFQRSDGRDAVRHQRRKQNGSDSEVNEAKANRSSGDTSDSYKSRLKSLGRPVFSSGDSGNESPECESSARRWVHFGDKWKGKKVTRPGRNMGKEVAVTPDNDTLERLYVEVKNLQAGLASLTAMYRGTEVSEKKLEKQFERTIELKQDEKEAALSKLMRDCTLLESKLVNSEEKFSEERKDLLRRLESEQEEKKKLHEILKAEQEERNKLHKNLNAEQEERNKLHERLKTEQEKTNALLKKLEAKGTTICQLEKMLQERDGKGREMSKQIENFTAERGQIESFLQEKYHGKFLSLNTEVISLKEALNIATQGRQNAESALLDATAEKESSRQLAMSVGKALEEEKAKLGVCNSELRACRSLLSELQEQVENSSKKFLDAKIKNEEALEQLSKLHKQEMEKAIAHEFAAGESQGMLVAEKNIDLFRNAMDMKLKDAQKELQEAHKEIAKIRQDMDDLQSKKGREEATLKETIRRVILKEQGKEALVVELSSVVRSQKLKLQSAQFDLERLAEVEEDLQKMHQEMIVARRKTDKYAEIVAQAENLQQKLAEVTDYAERQKESIEEKFAAQLVSLQKENETLATNLQKLEASEDAVKVKNKMLDSQNETIREIKLELSQAKEDLKKALRDSEALETGWSSRLQTEINQGEALQSKLAKQGVTMTALEDKLRFERVAKMAAEKTSKALQDKLAEKEAMFRYVEEEILQVKELYDNKLKEASVERDRALEQLKALHQEKEKLQDVLADEQRRRGELLEVAKTQEDLKKAEAIQKNLQLAQAFQRVVEVESELKSQGLAMESQKLVLVSKLDQLHKLLEEVREAN